VSRTRPFPDSTCQSCCALSNSWAAAIRVHVVRLSAGCTSRRSMSRDNVSNDLSAPRECISTSRDSARRAPMRRAPSEASSTAAESVPIGAEVTLSTPSSEAGAGAAAQSATGACRGGANGPNSPRSAAASATPAGDGAPTSASEIPTPLEAAPPAALLADGARSTVQRRSYMTSARWMRRRSSLCRCGAKVGTSSITTAGDAGPKRMQTNGRAERGARRVAKRGKSVNPNERSRNCPQPSSARVLDA